MTSGNTIFGDAAAVEDDAVGSASAHAVLMPSTSEEKRSSKNPAPSTNLADDDGADAKTAPPPMMMKRLLLSAFLLLAGVVLCLGGLKLHALESRLDRLQQQQLLQQLDDGGGTAAAAAAAAAKSRRRRSGEGEEEEEDVGDDAFGRKDVVYIVPDTVKTIPMDPSDKGQAEFPAAIGSLKWILSDETPDVPLNSAASLRPGFRHRGFYRDSRPSGSDGVGAETGSGSSYSFDPASGIITINKKGLYYIFSQITFFSLYGKNHYSININGSPFIRCQVGMQISIAACQDMTGENRQRCIKGLTLLNSCNTGGLRQLHPGDEMTIKGYNIEENIIVGSKYSFFGIIKI